MYIDEMIINNATCICLQAWKRWSTQILSALRFVLTSLESVLIEAIRSFTSVRTNQSDTSDIANLHETWLGIAFKATLDKDTVAGNRETGFCQ